MGTAHHWGSNVSPVGLVPWVNQLMAVFLVFLVFPVFLRILCFHLPTTHPPVDSKPWPPLTPPTRSPFQLVA